MADLSRTDTTASFRSTSSSWFGGIQAIRRELSDFVRTVSGTETDETDVSVSVDAGENRRRKKGSNDSVLVKEDRGWNAGKRQRVDSHADLEELGTGVPDLTTGSLPIMPGRLRLREPSQRSISQPIYMAVDPNPPQLPPIDVGTPDFGPSLRPSFSQRSFSPGSGLSTSEAASPVALPNRLSQTLPGAFAPDSAPPSRPISPRPRRTAALGGPSPALKRSQMSLSQSISSIDSVLFPGAYGLSKGAVHAPASDDMASSVASKLASLSTAPPAKEILNIGTSAADPSRYYSCAASDADSKASIVTVVHQPSATTSVIVDGSLLGRSGPTVATTSANASGMMTARRWGSILSLASQEIVEPGTTADKGKGRARSSTMYADHASPLPDPDASAVVPMPHQDHQARGFCGEIPVRTSSISNDARRKKKRMASASAPALRPLPPASAQPASAVEAAADSDSDFEMLDAPEASASQVDLAASTSRAAKRKRVASERREKAVVEVAQATKKIRRLESEVERLTRELDEARAANERNLRQLKQVKRVPSQTLDRSVHFEGSSPDSPDGRIRSVSDPTGSPALIVRKPSAGVLVGGSPVIIGRPFGNGPDALGERTPIAKAPSRKRLGSSKGGSISGLPGLARGLFGIRQNSDPPAPPPAPPPPPPRPAPKHLGKGRPKSWADPLHSWPDPAALQSQSRLGMNRSPVKGEREEGAETRRASAIGVGLKGVDMGRFISELKHVKLRKVPSSRSFGKSMPPPPPPSANSTLRGDPRNERLLHNAIKTQFTPKRSTTSLASVASAPLAPSPRQQSARKLQSFSGERRDRTPERSDLARTVYPSSGGRPPRVVMGEAVTTPRKVSAGSMELDGSTRQRIIGERLPSFPRIRSALIGDLSSAGLLDDHAGEERLGEASMDVDVDESVVERPRPSIRIVSAPSRTTQDGAPKPTTPKRTSLQLDDLLQANPAVDHRSRSSPVLANITAGRPSRKSSSSTGSATVTTTATKTKRFSMPSLSKSAASSVLAGSRSRRESMLSMLTRRSSTKPSALAENVPAATTEEEEVEEDSLFQGVGVVSPDSSRLVGYGVRPGGAEGTSGKEWIVVQGGRERLGDGEANAVRWGLKRSAIFAANPRLTREK